MTVCEVDRVLTEIFQNLFQDRTIELRDDLTAAQVRGWDSLNHVNLIIQVEEEFGVRFRNDEVAGLANVGALKTLVRSKLGM